MKTVTVGNTVWTKEKIQALIQNDNAALQRACLKIYSKQTQDEKATHSTSKVNGIGFNAYDAERLTELAVKIKQQKILTVGELAELRGRMKKYCTQLLNISIAEQQQKGQAA